MKIRVCDLCKDKDKKAQTIQKTVDRTTDPDGSRVDVYNEIDLCNNCLIKVYERMFLELTKKYKDYEANNHFLEEIKKIKKESQS